MNRILLLGGIAAVVVTAACAEVGTGPDVPASIELAPFAYPSVVVGDSLRDSLGVLAPVRAIVRNSAGEVITGARATYLYADATRDTALRVDSLTGIVSGRATVAQGRIAARIGTSLQVLRPLIATVRPDTVFRGTATEGLIVSLLPDTGRTRAQGNTTGDVAVQVRNRQGATPVGVSGWLVSFRLIRPANPTNDTTLGAFLVTDGLAASVVDTTSSDGTAARRVRVRPALFPVANGTARVTDSVIVEATTRYRGQIVRGGPVRIVVPVIRPASQ